MADWDVSRIFWALSRVLSQHACRSKRLHDKHLRPSDKRDSTVLKTVLHFIKTGASAVESIHNKCYFFHCRVIIIKVNL